MPSLQGTLVMARRALIAQQSAMAVTGNNIANVNTPGYARRRALMTPLPGEMTISGRLGGGVEVNSIRSLRDPFIEQRYRASLGESGYYGAEARQLGFLESMLQGMEETGLPAALDKFFNSWHDLSGDPNSSAHRNVVRESARNLINKLRGAGNQILNQSNTLTSEISSKLARINAINRELAVINSAFTGQGGDVAAVDDQRSILLDELSTLSGATYEITDVGSVTVYIGGAVVVERSFARNLEILDEGDGTRKLFLSDDTNRPLSGLAGEIGALENVLNNELVVLKDGLDNFTLELVRMVNAVHVTGYGRDGTTGRTFFDPSATGILDLELDSRIEMSVDAIATASTDALTDNNIALAIAELQTKPIYQHGSDNLSDLLRTTFSWLGIRVGESQDLAIGSALATEQMNQWRESVNGVSLDEEMAQMVNMQHAYNAAAKLITGMDRMLDTVLAM